MYDSPTTIGRRPDRAEILDETPIFHELRSIETPIFHALLTGEATGRLPARSEAARVTQVTGWEIHELSQREFDPLTAPLPVVSPERSHDTGRHHLIWPMSA
jgi:hypothetical protein